jgi:hypothetical protein
MDSEYKYTTTEEYMKANGKMTKDMEKARRSLLREGGMWASTRITSLMVKVYILGTTGKHTKESGNLAARMVLEYGKG